MAFHLLRLSISSQVFVPSRVCDNEGEGRRGEEREREKRERDNNVKKK